MLMDSICAETSRLTSIWTRARSRSPWSRLLLYFCAMADQYDESRSVVLSIVGQGGFWPQDRLLCFRISSAHQLSTSNKILDANIFLRNLGNILARATRPERKRGARQVKSQEIRNVSWSLTPIAVPCSSPRAEAGPAPLKTTATPLQARAPAAAPA